MAKIDYNEAEARLEFFADTIGVEAPEKLLSEEGSPSLELMMFCRKYGASLDWLFFGDVRGMIKDSAALAKLGLRH